MYLFSLLLVVLWCVSSAIGGTSVLHEKRDVPLREDLHRRRVARDVKLPMRIGLKHNQHAAENAERWLMDISHPDSANYGRYWTQKEVIEAFQPSLDTIRNVTSWLKDHGVEEFTHSDNKLWFAFDMSASHAESMLETEYFEHITEKGEVKVCCDGYYLPAHLRDHVDYITPGVQESDVSDRRPRGEKRGAPPSKPKHKRATSLSSALPLGSLPPYSSTSLAHCAEEVTPACIRALYNLSMADPNLPVSPDNAMGIFESTGDIYSQPDLNLFYKYLSPTIPAGTSPIYNPIDGVRQPWTFQNATVNRGPNIGPGYESDGDLEVALPIIYPQNASIYQVLHWTGGINFFNRFFDAIDGSYCTDAQQGNSSSGGKPHCGILKPTNVISISYGVGETLYTPLWQERQCGEFLKLGLQGVSVFVASGDEGVASLEAQRKPPGTDVCANANVTGGPRVFLPQFPPACPWVTTVGGTQIPLNGTITSPEISAVFRVPENGKLVVVGSSSGGFSLNFKAPSYQAEALERYFRDYTPPWPVFHGGDYRGGKGRYNRDGRGIPDVSANSVYTAVFARLGYQAFQGTSAAAPTVAAIFNRIIEERLRAGKGPLGFLNPTLYRNPQAFNDITQGANGFCYLDQGFEAVPGWDPVTGLGTPDYGRLLDVFMKLP